MQRIGLFGGSFNPIHNGHLHLVQTAKEGLGLSHVYLIPARVSPFKQAQTPAVSAEDRLAMCRLAAAEVPDCSVDACELEQARVSYTIYTVQEFHRRFPEAELVLLLGSDMFCSSRTGIAGRKFWSLPHLAWSPEKRTISRHFWHSSSFCCNMAKFLFAMPQPTPYLLQKFGKASKITKIFLAICRKK